MPNMPPGMGIPMGIGMPMGMHPPGTMISNPQGQIPGMMPPLPPPGMGMMFRPPPLMPSPNIPPQSSESVGLNG